MKRSLLVMIAALVLLIPAAAGDIATFVNLGFSPDSAYFLFGQYGVESDSGKPYAELNLVDTKKNDFVPKGSVRKVFDARLEPGQDCQGALFALYGDFYPTAKASKIDNLSPGRLLYVLLDGEEPPATLSFRDFKTDAVYEIGIQKKLSEGKTGITSSFDLALTFTAKDGSVKHASVGNANIKRADVKDYIVRRIIVAPDEKTLVFIIEKRMSVKGDQTVRYMVETLRL